MKRYTVWIGGAALLVLGLFLWFRFRGPAATTQTQYKVATVERGTIRKTVSASGTLQPWTTVDVKSKAGGRIDLLAVDLGDRVKSGQIIAKIDPTDSLLTYNQAKADTESAVAKQQQSGKAYGLQVGLSQSAIEQAHANLESAKANLLQVQARYASASTQSGAQPALTSAAINQAKASYDAQVQARNKLDATQAQDRAAAQSNYDQALANDLSAQTNLTRQESLLAKGYVAQSVVDQARASAGVTKAQVAGAKSKLDTLAAQQQAERVSADASVTQALAAYKSAQVQGISIQTQRNALTESAAAVEQAKAQVSQSQAAHDQAVANRTNNAIKALDITSSKASTERARASLSNAKATLDQTTVRAPAEGVVLLKYVEQGTIITSGLSLSSTGTSIIQLGEVSRMYVDVAVDETDIASVAVGQKVDIAFDAFQGKSFSGKVAKINPAAVVESNVTTIHVRVEVDNSSPDFSKLKPTMNATCEFVVGEAKDVISVSSDAIKTEGLDTYVEVVDRGKPLDKANPGTLIDVKSHRQKVNLGLAGTELTEVKSGLSGGEVVVTSTIVPTTTTPTTTGAAFGGGGPGGPPGMRGGGGTRSGGSGARSR